MVIFAFKHNTAFWRSIWKAFDNLTSSLADSGMYVLHNLSLNLKRHVLLSVTLTAADCVDFMFNWTLTVHKYKMTAPLVWIDFIAFIIFTMDKNGAYQQHTSGWS